jgi:hypothetical protein
MRSSFPLEEGGSATGVLITDKYPGPLGDNGRIANKKIGAASFDANCKDPRFCDGAAQHRVP